MLLLLETALASGYSIGMYGKWKKQKENPVIRLRERGRGLLREGGTQWDARIGGLRTCESLI